METLRECPQCTHTVHFKGLIADFECPNCHWALEEEVLEMDDGRPGDKNEDI